MGDWLYGGHWFTVGTVFAVIRFKGTGQGTLYGGRSQRVVVYRFNWIQEVLEVIRVRMVRSWLYWWDLWFGSTGMVATGTGLKGRWLYGILVSELVIMVKHGEQVNGLWSW